MKLTTFTDYSLRVLIYLAVEADRRATIGEIAGSFNVSEHHLTKVVHFLGRCGWLANVRGRGGGLELAMSPELIGVGAVVRQTEGEAVLAECFGPSHGGCAIAGVCRLRGILAEANDAFQAVLDRYTLADLVANRGQVASILFMDNRSAPTRGHPTP
jgi:Rrf2 family nitric oxide-sensitive transcriptional repressor